MENGFAEAPARKTALGGELVYRAHGGTSREMGNCFFTPVIRGTPINHWTADQLEMELNASLWGNDFEVLTRYLVVRGAAYEIGPIAHDDYEGRDRGLLFHQRAFVTPSGVLQQVRFVLQPGQSLEACVRKVEASRVHPGRYHRTALLRMRPV